MKQVNIKSDHVADLLEQVISQTGESKVDAVTKALEARLRNLNASSNAQRTLSWLNTSVWSELGADRGKAPSKQEQEELLGF